MSFWRFWNDLNIWNRVGLAVVAAAAILFLLVLVF